MVDQLMSAKKSSLELQAEDFMEDQLSPLHKRSKLDSSLQMMPAASLCNALDLPCPLGLRLEKSSSLLDLIQMKLSEGHNTKKDHKASGRVSADKLKASIFSASLLRIGGWEYKSRYEGDLVAKCYFAKRKLVWEVLDGGLKNKIEIQWSHIVAIKADFPDDGPETLDVVLARQPLFFRETEPQPKKHTLWQETSDFTGGQASIHRGHFLQCKRGFLGKHFEKIIQFDPHLNFLSQQSEILLESPYFEQSIPPFSELNESSKAFDLKVKKRPALFALGQAASPYRFHSSSMNDENQVFNVSTSESTSQENPSPITERLPSYWDQIKVPGFQPFMSTSGPENHLEQCISEQMTPCNPRISHDNAKNSDILEEITEFLLSDSQLVSASDEQHLMPRVDSLCCLLERDLASAGNLQTKSFIDLEVDDDGSIGENKSISRAACLDKFVESFPVPKDLSDSISSCEQAPTTSSKDSFGELLLDLPRIDSLPKLFYNT
uniref:TRF2/HOY1 PH-like domain-containing protein n=1 Tax=Manihot esculenta TaxID=3983 RepID=A0A2C9W1D7_MANES